MTDPRRGKRGPSTQFSMANPWGAYWNAMFPPAEVTQWINWKRMSTGLNIARRLWDQREYLRRTYESVHGADPAAWPSQHPAVILDEVLWMARAACLRCRWMDSDGYYMLGPGNMTKALLLARSHEYSNGSLCPSNSVAPEDLPDVPVTKGQEP